MKKNRGVIIGFGIVFGFITFAITVFFARPQNAVVFGVFTAATSILVFSLLGDHNARKYEGIDQTIGQEIILKDTANYYQDTLILNGVLYLTADRLIFVSFEKKPVYREEILLSRIKKVTYGKVFRHIQGLKLIMSDSSTIGFILADYETFLNHIQIGNYHESKTEP